jgi:hypothetical protein
MWSVKEKLEHNKSAVDQYLREKQISYAEMVTMDDGLEFLEYLDREGVSDSFAGAKYTKERSFIGNHEVFPLIYMMNILSGEWSVRRTQAILKNEAVLRILGFCDADIVHGLTKRGVKNQYGEGFARKSGIMASTTVVDNLACFAYEGLEECFNAYIRRVSAKKGVDFGDVYILDSTIVETDKNYPGALLTRRRDEEGEETKEAVWGFKVFILSSAKLMTPVAVHITTANDADAPLLMAMVQQGLTNMGKGKIKVILADRGFIDGQQLYCLKYKMGIDFVIPAKKNMDVWKCMTGLRDEYKDNIEEWQYGKKGLSGGYLSKGSVSYSQYAEKPVGNKKDKAGAPINAVVVTRWADKEIAPGKEKVLLTSLETNSATKIIRLYGQRSLIENRNFRELKQAAALNTLPQYKDANAAITAKIHMLLCVFTLAVFTVLVETVYAKSSDGSENIPKNIREFRFIKRCEKSQVFVLVKHYYHIYDMKEFLGLAGFALIPSG